MRDVGGYFSSSSSCFSCSGVVASEYRGLSHSEAWKRCTNLTVWDVRRPWCRRRNPPQIQRLGPSELSCSPSLNCQVPPSPNATIPNIGYIVSPSRAASRFGERFRPNPAHCIAAASPRLLTAGATYEERDQLTRMPSYRYLTCALRGCPCKSTAVAHVPDSEQLGRPRLT